MNKEQFLEEIFEHEREIYRNFEEYRNNIIDIFYAVYDIFEKNRVPYFVIFGTLLGIVRDHGLIPWDADLDLGIDISQMTKINQLLKEKLPDDFYLLSNLTDSNYPYYQTRVCKKGFDQDLHLDIFYFFAIKDSCNYEEIKKSIVRFYEIKRIKNVILKKTGNKAKDFYHEFKFFLKRMKYILISNRSLTKRIERFIKNNFDENGSRSVSFNGKAKCYESSVLKNLSRMEAFGKNVPVPSDYSSFLTSAYGTPFEYAPFEDRLSEYRQGCEQFISSKQN